MCVNSDAYDYLTKTSSRITVYCVMRCTEGVCGPGSLLLRFIMIDRYKTVLEMSAAWRRKTEKK